jgi:hypothetical protein
MYFCDDHSNEEPKQSTNCEEQKKQKRGDLLDWEDITSGSSRSPIDLWNYSVVNSIN